MSAPAARPSVAVPWESRTVQVVLLSTLLAPLGVPLVSPALPAFRDAFGLTDARASLLISTYFLTGIVLSPFIGALADRLGRKRVLVPSLVVFSLAGGAIAVGPSYGVVLAVRVVQGTAAAGIFVATVTLIGDAFEGVRRNAVLGVNTAALAAGAAIYPVLGGALTTVAWNVPFVAYLAGLPVALFAARALREPLREHGARGPGYLRRVTGRLASVDGVVLYGTAFVTEVLLFGAIVTAMPFLLAEQYALSPVFIGLALSAAEAAAAVVASQNGRLASRVSNFRLVLAGYVGYGVGLLVAWLAPSPLFVGLGVVVFGAGTGLTFPCVDAGVSDLVPATERAGALSVRNSVTFLGRAVGPVLFAGLAATTGYRPLLLWGGLAALAIGGALAALGWSRVGVGQAVAGR